MLRRLAATAPDALKFFDGPTPHTLGAGDGAVQRLEARQVGFEHCNQILLFHDLGLERVVLLEAEPGSSDLVYQERLFGRRGLIRIHDFVTDLSEAGGRRIVEPELGANRSWSGHK
jgi:hypothetical protein